ncbi:MAG TPA: hypothetical protein PKC87_05360, partial [Candidatus Absconditabacterales bacterium]|nr:hypothetical protein [Candidatus Absconditabacterales bacterium]
MILMILRISALMSDIDFLPLSIKQRLNTLFLKNPEELVGYLTGMIIYLIKVFAHIFIKLPTYSLEEEIQKEKESYSRIIDIQGNGYLIGEYLLGIILTIGLITLIPTDFTVRTYYIGFGLLIARYLTMFIQLKHLPHFPIAREILLLIRAIGAYFSKHPFIRN